MLDNIPKHHSGACLTKTLKNLKVNILRNSEEINTLGFSPRQWLFQI